DPWVAGPSGGIGSSSEFRGRTTITLFHTQIQRIINCALDLIIQLKKLTSAGAAFLNALKVNYDIKT
ncbi:hypothetical protein ACC771_26185, partial [Rhizobium ruizarguesonis]